jgi:GTP-binding protein
MFSLGVISLFIDQATISVSAGNGGNGCASFRREKFVRFGGPDGGSGGTGGDVYLRVNRQLNTLYSFSWHQRFQAENGVHGMSKKMQGRRGQDLYIDVPPGTVVRDAETADLLGDLTTEGQTLLVARGGRGNEVFKSPTRQTPGFAERGEPGQERRLKLELRLIADVGLLGKPNAGKSTLLARISAARPKIADYPFTTLQPNLGVVALNETTFVVADLPGLIEGAHEGTGLGLQFLRHVERTRLLVHLIDGLSEDPVADFRAINHELALYSERLAAKPQIVVVNKLDVPNAQECYAAIQQALREECDAIWGISAASGQGVRELLNAIAERLAQMPVEEPPQELFVFRPDQRESKDFSITVQDAIYHVVGEEIERLAIMTDWSNYEGVERFHRILESRGIAEALRKAGVALGDTVTIGEIELEWR